MTRIGYATVLWDTSDLMANQGMEGVTESTQFLPISALADDADVNFTQGLTERVNDAPSPMVTTEQVAKSSIAATVEIVPTESKSRAVYNSEGIVSEPGGRWDLNVAENCGTHH